MGRVSRATSSGSDFERSDFERGDFVRQGRLCTSGATLYVRGDFAKGDFVVGDFLMGDFAGVSLLVPVILCQRVNPW